MTATPLNEQIMQQLVSMLGTLTTDNGYSQTVKTITRAPFILEFDEQLAPIVFVECSEELLESGPTNLVESYMTVTIVGGLIPANQDISTLEALSTSLNLFEADVKILFGSSTQNNTLHDLVIYTKFRRSAKDIGYLLPGRGAFALEMEVFYRYAAADPSQRGY